MRPGRTESCSGSLSHGRIATTCFALYGHRSLSKVCMVERRVNRLRVSDTKYDVSLQQRQQQQGLWMYERAVTFEGPTYYSEAEFCHDISMLENGTRVTLDTTR
eukprot:4306065-Amphidinium_carterae.2